MLAAQLAAPGKPDDADQAHCPLPVPVVRHTPEVLGTDEFALRRGRDYGTLLVDVTARRLAGHLAGAVRGSFAAWLAGRPGAQVICRDRAGCYADAGTRAALGAIQVTDR